MGADAVVLSPDDVVEIKIKKGEDVSLIADGQEHVQVKESQSTKSGIQSEVYFFA